MAMLLTNKNIAICCLVRDCRKKLEKHECFFKELRSCFGESYLIFVENDSVDGTAELLQSWKSQDSKVIVDSFTTNTKTLCKYLDSGVNPSYSRYRIEKMARYRNRYLRIINEEIGLGFLDWVIVLDPDVHEISVDCVIQSFVYSKVWDVVHANGRWRKFFSGSVYFDTYAYKSVGDYTPLTEIEIQRNQQLLSEISGKDELMPVRSGFNGLAIYKAASLEGVEYECIGNQDDRVEVLCEHMAIHDAMRKNGYKRQYLNPKMALFYNSRFESFVEYVKKAIKFFLGR